MAFVARRAVRRTGRATIELMKREARPAVAVTTTAAPGAGSPLPTPTMIRRSLRARQTGRSAGVVPVTTLEVDLASVLRCGIGRTRRATTAQRCRGIRRGRRRGRGFGTTESGAYARARGCTSHRYPASRSQSANSSTDITSHGRSGTSARVSRNSLSSVTSTSK